MASHLLRVLLDSGFPKMATAVLDVCPLRSQKHKMERFCYSAVTCCADGHETLLRLLVILGV